MSSFNPLLNLKRASEVAKILWESSSLKIENIHYDKLSEYLGHNLKKEKLDFENISDLVYTEIENVNK